jgi:hypothetical protein
MKLLLQNPFAPLRKKMIINSFIGLILFLNISTKSFSQCAVGYTRDTINWDYLDFLHTAATSPYGTVLPPPASYVPVTAAMAKTQYFSVSGNRVTFTNTNSMPIGGATQIWGDVTTHTGETLSFGNGEDVKFMPAVAPATYSMTFSFQTAVRDVKFSLYDIDRLQKITVTALNGAAALNITMDTVVLTSKVNVTGSGTTSASGTADNLSVANTSNDGTANVQIAGLVTSFTIAVSGTTTAGGGSPEDGGFFLSDISACFANPSFPVNYYQPYTEPFTGQPAYFLANPQNLHVYMVNPATAVADYLFSDPGTNGNKMNSFAYDPVNHWLYYVMDNSASSVINLELKKADLNTEPVTISTVIPNLFTYGIPCFTNGVELAAAAFYNGSLYLGIEGLNGGSYTGAESNVWKIDFDVSGNATTYSQVFGTLGATGASPFHDWGDIAIKDGILITHGTINTLSDQYIHYNMQTGTATTYNNVTTPQTAGQLGQIYNGNIYWIRSAVALYNNNGTRGATTNVTTTTCSPAWSTNAGDASDPYKPKCDFGDAPASYDPVALSPAVHQKHCNNSTLMIGSVWDREWSKNVSANASGDGTDEDGIGTVTILNSNNVVYNHVQNVTVTNNTGAAATLGGWLDYNVNGVFDASEGVIVSVPSTGSGTQVVTLSWLGLRIPNGTANTFLRIRLVLGSTALTTSNATGWYDDGEVEDYPVVTTNVPLKINLLDFNVTLTKNKKAELKWSAINDNEADGFEIQRSLNQNDWQTIGWENASSINTITNYTFTDNATVAGKTYYRLRLVEKNGSSSYSDIKQIYLSFTKNEMTIAPNPISNMGVLIFSGNSNAVGVLKIRSLSGQTLISKSVIIGYGENRIPLDVASLKPGIYIAEFVTKEKRITNKLAITR